MSGDPVLAPLYTSTTLNVIANVAPEAVNDGPYNVNTGGTISGNVLANDTDDNGDDLDLAGGIPVPDHGSFTSFNLETGAFVYQAPINWDGSFTFSYTVTDGVDSDTGTATIIVNDTIVPEVNTMDTTVYLNALGTISINPTFVENGSTDNIGVDSFALDKTLFDCNNLGNNTVTLTVYDAEGNYSSDTAIVLVKDTIAPIALCKDSIVVFLDTYGSVTIAEDSVDNGSTDVVCGGLSFDTDVTSFGCSDVFETNIVTLTVTDASGNDSYCTSKVVVKDTVSPVVACKPATVYLDETGFVSIAEDSIDNGSSDACGITFDTDTTEFDCSDVFETNIVTLKVTDASGNWSICSSEVTVLDTVRPIVKCKPITVYLDDDGFATIAEDSVDNGSSDACGISAYETDTTEFDCSDIFETNIVTLKVTDASGNWSICTSEVTVLDTISPVVACKPITVYLDETGFASIEEDSIDNGSSDACGVAFDTDTTEFGCTDLFENNIISLKVTDLSGNSSYCKSQVVVKDTISPIALCKDSIVVYLDSDGIMIIAEDSIDDGSNDIVCGDLSFDTDITEFSCSDIAEDNIVTLRVTDASRNSSYCETKVVVKDTIAPTILRNNINAYLNEEGTVNLAPDMVDNGSYDACGILGMRLDSTYFDCSSIGEHGRRCQR